jgi:phosphatidylserine/phosphatidylglycerophosphate/cardiolipin synthase-like enzyme
MRQGWTQGAAIAVLALVAFAPAAAGQPAPRYELHYSPAEDLEAIDVATIDGAAHTFDGAAFVLTDVPVMEALTRAAERGVRVRLIVDARQDRPRGERIDAALAALIAEPTVVIKEKQRGPWMHLKAYVVDGELLRFGAANFTAGGEKRQDNDLMLTDDPALIKAFQTEFETLWGRP